MADADRDSDGGEDDPMSPPSDTSGDQSCESSDEGMARVAPSNQQNPQHQPMSLQHQQNLAHHTLNHQMNQNHQQTTQRHMEGEIKVRNDIEALKTSLPPHLASLASLAQGAPMSAPNSVFALATAGPTYQYAPSGFVAPAPPPPPQPAGSASSSSSEGSAAGWSFEEQYKQVRQLYELSDDPKRKEFLDELFGFMTKRGTPITRLPIMAKSVLDLYELYRLVVARGGLVEVINKKLWQEIIKGLRLPSSITSAAFTLRTQYMKYLYDFECDKENLSIRRELDAAIEGNKREGRRSSSQYDAQAALALPSLNRGVPGSSAPLPQHMQQMALPFGPNGIPHLPPMPPHIPQIARQELEFRIGDYIKAMQTQREIIRRSSTNSPPSSPPLMPPPDQALVDLSRIAMWSLYNIHNPDAEPQREALNLSDIPSTSSGIGVPSTSSVLSVPSTSSGFSMPSTSNGLGLPSTSSGIGMPSTSNGFGMLASNGFGVKREAYRSTPPPAKRRTPPSTVSSPRTPPTPRPQMYAPHLNGRPNGVNGAAFKITTTGDANTGDQKLVVSIEINGVTYEGELFPSQNDDDHNHRHMVS